MPFPTIRRTCATPRRAPRSASAHRHAAIREMTGTTGRNPLRDPRVASTANNGTSLRLIAINKDMDRDMPFRVDIAGASAGQIATGRLDQPLVGGQRGLEVVRGHRPLLLCQRGAAHAAPHLPADLSPRRAHTGPLALRPGAHTRLRRRQIHPHQSTLMKAECIGFRSGRTTSTCASPESPGASSHPPRPYPARPS